MAEFTHRRFAQGVSTEGGILDETICIAFSTSFQTGEVIHKEHPTRRSRPEARSQYPEL
jgi:hypothetical protein